MKKRILVYDQYGAQKEKEVEYIPVRFIIAIALIALETLGVLAMVILCAWSMTISDV